MKVTAPASTANMGPGFDCLGAALSIGCELTASPGDTTWGISVRASSQPDEKAVLPSAELFLRAARAVAGELPSLGGTMQSDIPMSAGLGSSAAAVAAGLLLGCAIAQRDPDPEELLRIGTPIEGHPDNLAAVLFGGIVLVIPDGDGWAVQRFDPAPSVRPLILLPREQLATAQARGVLPDSVPRADAVTNAARTAGLVALLTGRVEPTMDGLLACTEDLVHQPYRAPLMPRTAEAMQSLRSAGIPAALSGAGPSVVCLVVRGEEEGVRRQAAQMEGWELLELDWDLEGARIVQP